MNLGENVKLLEVIGERATRERWRILREFYASVNRLVEKTGMLVSDHAKDTDIGNALQHLPYQIAELKLMLAILEENASHGFQKTVETEVLRLAGIKHDQ